MTSLLHHTTRHHCLGLSCYPMEVRGPLGELTQVLTRRCTRWHADPASQFEVCSGSPYPAPIEVMASVFAHCLVRLVRFHPCSCARLPACETWVMCAGSPCCPDGGTRVPTMCAAARQRPRSGCGFRGGYAHGSCGTGFAAFTRTAGGVSPQAAEKDELRCRSARRCRSCGAAGGSQKHYMQCLRCAMLGHRRAVGHLSLLGTWR